MFALSIAEASPAAIIVYTLRPKPNSALILIKFPASHDGGPDGSSRYGRRHGRGWVPEDGSLAGAHAIPAGIEGGRQRVVGIRDFVKAAERVRTGNWRRMPATFLDYLFQITKKFTITV